MNTVAPLERRSTVDELAAALRARILDADLDGGTRLVEQDLARTYDVARHTVRAALRVLVAEGLVALEPHRGARVAALDADGVSGLYELRAALEIEATRLALERNGGALPNTVTAAVERLANACRRARPRVERGRRGARRASTTRSSRRRAARGSSRRTGRSRGRCGC